MAAKLVGSEHELLLRLLAAGIMSIGIKGIDNYRPVHFDRFGLFVSIEEHTPTKTAQGRLTLLMQYGVRPEGDDLLRRQELFFVILPGQARDSQVERSATGRQQEDPAGQRPQQ
jgi:hypothetical protein